MSQTSLAQDIIATRYARPTNPHIEEYLVKFGIERSSIAHLLDELAMRLDGPYEWNGYHLPKELLQNRAVFERRARQVADDFRKESHYTADDIRRFFLDNHLIFKYATRRWLLVNAGTAIEQFVIAQNNVEPNFLRALEARGVRVGDRVVHFHVVSNSERQSLARVGLGVPYEHWDRSYYVEMLAIVGKLLESNPDSTGLFCEDSWVFDPAIHRLASDGRPLVSFGFLADDRLVGERFLVGVPSPTNDYAVQYEFALRSLRRRSLHEKGEFIPKTYGIFYPRQLLKLNLPDILKS